MFKKLTQILLLAGVLLVGAQARAVAQTQVVKGLVVDASGNALPGVTVYAEGKESGGVLTDLDGRYAISGLSARDLLIFSYVGFETQKFTVGSNTTLDVILKEDTEMLEETVVVAFAKQKKESVIGAIQTIAPKELKVPQSNLTTALAGRVAGLISYQTSGEPGADNANFFVRGVTSFGYKASPLILIDNIEVSSEDLARLEPENIASFSIMKDATATALYGAKGANGVILVTTKTGEKGALKITGRVETSISTPTKIQQFLDGVQYMNLYNEAVRMRNPEASLVYSREKIENTRQGTNPMLYPNVDWYGELFKNQAFNTKATITASGGGEVARYYLSAAYTNENGLMKVDKLNNYNNNININRYNLRANIDVNLTKTTKAAVKLYSLLERYNGPAAETSDIFSSVMRANPVNFPKTYSKDIDNSYYYVRHILFGNMGQGSYPNPYANLVSGYKDRFSSTTNAQFQIDQDLSMLTKGLSLRGLASFMSYGQNVNTRTMTPFYYGLTTTNSELGVTHSLTQLTEGTETLNDPSSSSTAYSSFYFEVAAQWNRTFGRHDLSALLVGQMKESLNTISGDNAFATLPSRNLGLSGRLTYGYDSRYFIEGNFGYNGSEKFAIKHRFGFFPSVGGAWILSNEHFYGDGMKKVLPQFKLKVSYGLVGNDEISNPDDRFFYLSNVNTNSSSYGHTFGYDFNNSYNGYNVVRYSNEEIGWEVAEKSNFGLEANLLDIFNIQAEYFREHRTAIYQTRQSTPLTLGTTAAIKGNIGEARASGVDASVDANWSLGPDFWLSGRANFTYSTSEYVDGGDIRYAEAWRNRPGHSINQQWGYVAERLFIDKQDILNSPSQFDLYVSPGDRVSAEDKVMPGDIKYVDINKDGVIDEKDQVAIGFPSVPEIIYGFGLSMGWKFIDFSFFFQGSARSSFFIDPTSIEPFTQYRNAMTIVADNYWSETNPDPYAFWPRLSTTQIENNLKTSTWWLRNGAFLRLKQVEVGFSLPRKTLSRLGLTQGRLFFSGNNLLCFSKFKLWDPEMGGYGIGYPIQRVYNVGINVSF